MARRFLKDTFVKGSDNIISKTLTEDDSAISVAWTELDVVIGPVTLTRTVSERGISFASGIVEITPSEIDEDLSALIVGEKYFVWFVVKTATDTAGVVYGAGDSDVGLIFQIENNPIG